MNIQKMMNEAQKVQAKLQEDMAKAREALVEEQLEIRVS